MNDPHIYFSFLSFFIFVFILNLFVSVCLTVVNNYRKNLLFYLCLFISESVYFHLSRSTSKIVNRILLTSTYWAISSFLSLYFLSPFFFHSFLSFLKIQTYPQSFSLFGLLYAVSMFQYHQHGKSFPYDNTATNTHCQSMRMLWMDHKSGNLKRVNQAKYVKTVKLNKGNKKKWSKK